MKPGWQHTKEAITTDQKNLTDDQRIHEQEKHELKSSEKNVRERSKQKKEPASSAGLEKKE